MKISALFKGLPVVMYHIVNTEVNNLSVHPTVFETHCKTLARKGWHTLSLKEAEDYFVHGAALPKKSVWLTFDDGSLDNLVYAYPILEKYGLKGTIFPVLKLVEQGEIRPTIKDVWSGRLLMHDLPQVDYPFIHNPQTNLKERKTPFLNWNEIRFLEESGVMQIAPHSLTHESVIARPRYKGFYSPEDRLRTFDRIRGGIPWGMPRFKLLPVLASPAFVPSPKFVEEIKNLVPQNKLAALEFFKNKDKVQELQTLAASFSLRELGSFESEEEANKRIREEMHECQAIMEKELGRKAITFCWPWGKFCKKALEYGKEAGFKVFVTTKYGGNYPGKPEKVCRFSITRPKNNHSLIRHLKLLSCNFWAEIYGFLRPKLRKLGIKF